MLVAESTASAVVALEAAAIEVAKVGIRTERVLTDNGGPIDSTA